MGVEYTLIDDAAKEYVLLGKRNHFAGDVDGFQMDDARIVAFLASRPLGREGAVLRLSVDDGDDYERILGTYRCIDSR